MNGRIISNRDPARQGKEELKRRAALMSLNRSMVAMLCFSPICFLMSFLAFSHILARQPHAGSHLAYGTWYSQDTGYVTLGPISMQRPRVRIQLEGPLSEEGLPTTVRSVLYYTDPKNLPKRVSFYFSGDPSEEVILREENSPLWMALFFFLMPFVVAILYSWGRKKYAT